MTAKISTNIESLEDGTRVVLRPLPSNPIHNDPVAAMYLNGCFWCDGSSPADGPDYYFGDVLRYCEGWTPEFQDR